MSLAFSCHDAFFLFVCFLNNWRILQIPLRKQLAARTHTNTKILHIQPVYNWTLCYVHLTQLSAVKS